MLTVNIPLLCTIDPFLGLYFGVFSVWRYIYSLFAIETTTCEKLFGFRLREQVGWMCERKATLIKHDIILEREQTER